MKKIGYFGQKRRLSYCSFLHTFYTRAFTALLFPLWLALQFLIHVNLEHLIASLKTQYSFFKMRSILAYGNEHLLLI